MSDAAPPRWVKPVTLLGAALIIGWLAAYAVTGRLSDEGLHALAARSILNGRLPYVDFQYHQPPLFCYLLAGWFRLTSVSMLQAKLFAASLGLVVLAVTVALARRAGAPPAGVALALLLAGLSPSLMLHLGYVQSQALATLLGLAACLTVLRWPNAGGALLAGVLLGLAASARLSLAILVVPVAWYFAARVTTARTTAVPLAASPPVRNDFGEALTGGKTAALALLFGFAVTLGLVLAPFALAGGLGDALFLPFGLGGGTVTRAFSALYLSTSGPGAALAQRLSGWPNQLLYYAPIWLAVLLAWRQRAGGHALLLGAAVALTIAHGVLPQRINHSYLTVAMPFWLAWLATCRITWPRGLKAVALAVVAVACAGAATKRGIDRLDRSGRRTVAAELRDIGDELARTVEPDEPIFTFAAECAVAADRDVWPGCEPGYFSLFPNLTAEEAASVHVLEDRAVLRLIARREPRWLLLHDSAFYPVEPTETEWPAPWQYWAELAGRYEPIQRWAAVGEKREPLTLYKRIPKGASAGSANRAQH